MMVSVSSLGRNHHLPPLLLLLLGTLAVVQADVFGAVPATTTTTTSTTSNPKPLVSLEVWTQPLDDWTTDEAEPDGKGKVLDGRNVKLFDALQQVHWALGPTVVQYEMNQVVNSGQPECIFRKPENCQMNCVCKNHRYCQRPPEKSDKTHSHTTGKELLGETIRRICAWNLIKEAPDYDPSKFLDYMFHFHEAKCDQHNFGRTCLTQVYQLSELDEDAIVDCAKAAGGFNADDNALLNASLTHAMAQPFYDDMKAQANKKNSKFFPLLRLNNATLKADAYKTPEALLQTICDATKALSPTSVLNPPAGCQDISGAIQTGINSHTAPPDAATIILQANEQYQQDIATAASTTYKPLIGDDSTVNAGDLIFVDIWTTPLFDWNTQDQGNGPNKLVYQRFQKLQYDFIDYPNLILRPRNYVYNKKQVCGNITKDHPDERRECADIKCTNHHKYCALGPDEWMITGKTMVEETLRRACVWELMPKREFFDYWVFFHKNQCDNVDYHEDCITQALESVNIPAEKVEQCMNNTGGLTSVNNTVLDDLIAIQDVTFPEEELDYNQLPIVTVDGKKTGSLKMLDLYQQICKSMKQHHDKAVQAAADQETAVPPPIHRICQKSSEELKDYVNTFYVDLKKIYEREKKFEEDVAKKTNTKPPAMDPETSQTKITLVEVWTTPLLDYDTTTVIGGDGPNIELFEKMKDLVIGFGSSIVFRPQYYLYNSEEVCGGVDPRTGEARSTVDPAERKKCEEKDCTNTARYCSFGPKKDDYEIKGNILLSEALRRTCLWHMYGRNSHKDDTVKFFDYLSEYHTKHCHTKGSTENCLTDIFNGHEINHYDLGHCQVGAGDTRTFGGDNVLFSDMVAVQNAKFYYHQLDPANLPIVLINGQPLEEGGTQLSLDELFRKVCDEFPDDDDAHPKPDICQGDLDENLGEDLWNATEVPTLVLEELEGAAYNESGVLDTFNFTSPFNFTEEDADISTMAPTEEEGDESSTVAATTVAPTTETPTTEAPEEATVPPTTETPIEATGSPTAASTTLAPTAASTTFSPTTATTTSSPTAGTETSSPTAAMTSSPTAGPEETETEMESPAEPATTTPPATTAPEAATTEPVAAETAATQPPVDIPADTATGNGLWGVEGAEEAPAVTERTSGDIKSANPQVAATRPADAQMATQQAQLDMEAPPLSEVDTLEELDMTLVTSAIDHMEALQKCDVDTKMLIKKLMALGAEKETMQQEISSIETDLPLFMSETCPHEDGEDIMERMRHFQKCSMYNLQELIESFPSTAIGVAMRCTNAYKEMTPQEAKAGFVPEACIRTIEAQGVLGRALFGLFLYPDVSCPCFEKLAKHIPECTADVWPIPINGVLVKTQSCLVGQYCLAVDGLCEKNLKILNECLPAEDVKPRDIPCGKVFDSCSEFYDNVPPFLNAAPLPDACVRIAEGSEFYGTNLVKRYNTFRHECGQNLELWEGHTPVAEFKAFVEDGINGINLYGFDFLSGISGGFLLGIAFCIIVVIVRKICRCICNCLSRCCKCCGCGKKKNARPRSKDYATVETTGDDVPEYRD